MVRMIRILKLVKERRKILEYLSVNYGLTYSTQTVIQVIFFFIVILHLFCCLWFLLNKIYLSSNCWIFVYNLEDSPVFDQYIGSLYYISETILTVGYGDMTPTTFDEIIFITIMMWMGVGFYLVIIGSLSSYLFMADTL